MAARFPAAVVMLDLASEQIAGATLAEVSTVLYYKVLQYAGYSRNLKVAALERKLKKDGRFAEFEALFREETGEAWADYRNDELVADSVLPSIAHQLYPALFRNDQAFTTASSDVIYLMDDRVQEMIDIVREASGKEYIIFVIDEIGQYVGSYQTKDPRPPGTGRKPEEPRRGQGLDHRHRAADADRGRPARDHQLTRAVQAQGPLPDHRRAGIQRHQGDLLPPAARQIVSRRRDRSERCSTGTGRLCATTRG